MPATTTDRESFELRIWFRLVAAAAIGTVIGLVVPIPRQSAVTTHVLIGFIGFALVFCLPLLRTVLRADPGDTQSYVDGMDATRSETDVIVVLAALGSLGGVVLMLLAGGSKPPFQQAVEGLVTFATVGCGWLLIHTTLTLRYARHWYNAQPDCVDFNTDDPPQFSDFAYIAFTVGMSFAISDTNLKTAAVRRIALHHALLSYLFGTVIIGATINLLAGLGQ